MTLAANPIQTAIYQRLKSQLSPVQVYDHVPQAASFPYVMIGDDTSIPWDTKGNDGQEFTCTIHVWDAEVAGRKSVKNVMQLIYQALHQREEMLTLSGYALAELRCEFTQSFQETAEEGSPDKYYHGVMRFRALVHDS